MRGNEYALISYPVFAAWFVCLAVAAQAWNVLSQRRGLVEFFANYSYSLFLIHMTIVNIIVVWSPMPLWLTFSAAIVVSNVAAYYFAKATEAKHKKLAGWIMLKLRPSSREAAPAVYERRSG